MSCSCLYALLESGKEELTHSSRTLTVSDAYGRRPAFNLTLLVSTIFGLLSSIAPSFPLLCLALFALGTGVGGSMPTDGTLFLENLPTRKRYLLTALSVFFAAGSVVSSVLGLAILPRFSCPEKGACTPEMNRGWRYLLGSLGLLVSVSSLHLPDHRTLLTQTSRAAHRQAHS